jgi:hypothetical protein
MKINLHIERLALQGFQLTPTDRTELTAALQVELSRLLASADDSRSWADLPSRAHIQAGRITYQPGSSPVRLGQSVAASLLSCLQNPPPQVNESPPPGPGQNDQRNHG